jgi:hypothetical protein
VVEVAPLCTTNKTQTDMPFTRRRLFDLAQFGGSFCILALLDNIDFGRDPTVAAFAVIISIDLPRPLGNVRGYSA